MTADNPPGTQHARPGTGAFPATLSTTFTNSTTSTTASSSSASSAAAAIAAAAQHDAALKGAAMAFGSKPPPVKPKPKFPPPTTSTDNGALAAARLSTRVQDAEAAARIGGGLGSVGYHRTGESSSSGTQDVSYEHGRGGLSSQQQQRLSYMGGTSNSMDQLLVPRSQSGSKSPSFIAANLAASRSASVTPNHTGQSSSTTTTTTAAADSAFQRSLAAKLRRTPRPESPRPLPIQRPSSNEPDTTSIPPTNSLIGIFEKAGGESAAVTTQPRPRIKKKSPSTVNIEKSSGTNSVTPPTPRPKPVISKPAASVTASLQPVMSKPATPTLAFAKPTVTRPTTPKSKPVSASKSTEPKLESRPIPLPPPSKPRDIPLPKQPARLIAKPTGRSTLSSQSASASSSDDSFVSASEDNVADRPPAPPPRRRPAPAADRATGTASEVEALADAIVASSLASSLAQSRNSSPSKSLGSNAPAVPPPRKSNHRHSRFTAPFHSHAHDSRGASPVHQGLRTTMRKPPKDEDNSKAAKAKKHLTKKHAHHEGDRKRWRNAVTDRERRRYEAVWASNKGLYMSADTTYPAHLAAYSGEASDRVLNLVVRDIWNRSRLGDDVLEEVYELVDRSRCGSLNKEEFVVGMWLIDQRLKGRKLPIKVSPSVWQSVGMLGVKVRNKK